MEVYLKAYLEKGTGLSLVGRLSWQTQVSTNAMPGTAWGRTKESCRWLWEVGAFPITAGLSTVDTVQLSPFQPWQYGHKYVIICDQPKIPFDDVKMNSSQLYKGYCYLDLYSIILERLCKTILKTVPPSFQLVPVQLCWPLNSIF